MGKASEEVISDLKAKIHSIGGDLPKVAKKKMFGCHALFANGSVFSMVWKEGRIGVRLPDEKLFSKLMEFEGASAWKTGRSTVSHWVLVPPVMHEETKKLTSWIRTAHELALKTSKTTPKKKTAKVSKKASR